MSRNKVANRGKNLSISLPYHQVAWINMHPIFKLSKFLQVKIQEYMELCYDVERLEKNLHINKKEVIC